MSRDEAVTALFDDFESTEDEASHLATLKKIRHLVLDASAASSTRLQRETLECLVMFLSPLTLSSNEKLLCEALDAFAVTFQEILKTTLDDVESTESASLLREADAVRQTLLGLGRDGISVSVQLRVVYFASSILASSQAEQLADVAKKSSNSGSNSSKPEAVIAQLIAQTMDAALLSLCRAIEEPSSIVSSYALASIAFIGEKSRRICQLMLPKVAQIYQNVSAQVSSASTVYLRRMRAVLSKMAASCGDAFASLKGISHHQQHFHNADDPASEALLHHRIDGGSVPSSLTVYQATPQDSSSTDMQGGAGLDSDYAAPGQQELQSSIGLVSVAELVEMVILSVRHIDVHAESMQALHLAGLRAMQLAAARRAQAAEWDRIRRQDCEGLVAASCGELISTTKNGPMAYVSAEAYLERPQSRSVFLKHGFFSALRSYSNLRQPKNRSSEHVVRAAQALISRALSKLPETVVDLGHDAVLELFQDDLRSHTPNSRELVSSSFDLVLQVLFVKFSQLLMPSANQLAFDGSTRSGPLGTTSGSDAVSASASGSTVLESAGAGVIDTENPVSWVYETSASSSSTRSGKRGRDDGGSIDYANDTVDVPSSYGHAVTRVLQLLMDERRQDLFVKLLLECPAITRYLWNFILTTVCLSPDHAALGVVSLTRLVVSRPFVRTEALSGLLHLCTGARLESRRLAVVQIGKLMVDHVLDAATEELIVKFAKRFVARLPVLRNTNLSTLSASGGGGGGGSAEQDKLLLAWVDRHLSLFLRVCSIPRHCKNLKILFDVFAECASSKGLQDALRQVPEIGKLISALFAAPGQLFELEVMPLLRRHPKGSEALVQKCLVVVARDLRAKISASVTPTGSVPSSVKDTISIIAGHCKAMFNDSSTRLPDGSSVKDARFMTPVLSTVPRADLRQTYLASLLRLALLEDSSSAAALLVDAFKEVLSPCDIRDWSDDAERSIQLSELLLFLHTVEGLSNKAFKAALTLLLSMTRSFDATSAQLLYAPGVILKSLKMLIKLKPIPPQTLYTALIACRLHSAQIDMRRAILREVLEPLSKESIYNEKNDQQLWKGALLLVEEFWGAVEGCREFLEALPDKVLTKALREHPKLCDFFRQAVGANASYAHIFAAI